MNSGHLERAGKDSCADALGAVFRTLNRVAAGWSKSADAGTASERAVLAIERLAGTTGSVKILVEALHRLSYPGNGNFLSNGEGNKLAQDALKAFWTTRKIEDPKNVEKAYPCSLTGFSSDELWGFAGLRPPVEESFFSESKVVAQAEAWEALGRTLTEVYPQWGVHAATGMNAAVNAIKHLAKRQEKSALQPVFTLDQVQVLADILTSVSPGTKVCKEVLRQSAKQGYVVGENDA